jgi:hypothetical protein
MKAASRYLGLAVVALGLAAGLAWLMIEFSLDLIFETFAAVLSLLGV